MVKKMLLQIKFVLIFLMNILYRFIPIWWVRRVYLRLFKITIGQKSSVHSVRFFNFGNVKIGCNSTINSGCYIDNRRPIKIGNNVSIAHDSKIYTYGHDIDSPSFETKGKSVTIEDYVCIFSNVIILPGVKIGKGAVVLPGSVVTKDIEPYSVVGGNPAIFIRKREENLKYNIDYRYLFAL